MPMPSPAWISFATTSKLLTCTRRRSGFSASRACSSMHCEITVLLSSPTKS